LNAFLKLKKIGGAEIRDLNVEFLQYLIREWEDISPIIEQQFRSMEEFSNQSLSVLMYVYMPLISQLINNRSQAKSESKLIKILQEVLYKYYLSDLLVDVNFLRCSYNELDKSIDAKLTDPIINKFISLHPLRDPELLGFSLIAETQLPFAILLARIIKSHHPKITTILGGAYVTEMLVRPDTANILLNDFNYLVVHEGESALCAIIKSLESGELVDHPNVFPNANSIAPSFHVEPINMLPSPDFSDLDLDMYFSDDLNLPICSSKGCSWGRCMFCSQNALSYRESEIPKFVADVKRVIDETGISHFQVCDENISPNRLKVLSETIIRSGLKIRWFIQIRFDKRLDYALLELMKKAGCYQIEFGLESGSPSLLRKIKKGINIQIATNVLQICSVLNYEVIINCMVGFPEESIEQAYETSSFLDGICAKFPDLRFMCNTQIVKIYSTARYAIDGKVKYEPYPLSTVAKWQGPGWVEEFSQRFRNHLIFLSRFPSKHSYLADCETKLEKPPRFKLSSNCFLLRDIKYDFLRNKRTTEGFNYIVLLHSDSSHSEVFFVNHTMLSLINEMIKHDIELCDLRQSFLNYYQNHISEEVVDAFENAMLRLNTIGALSIC
jgi:radical SAM superfamily enzyme YgiQ (UPF0313 family)